MYKLTDRVSHYMGCETVEEAAHADLDTAFRKDPCRISVWGRTIETFRFDEPYTAIFLFSPGTIQMKKFPWSRYEKVEELTDGFREKLDELFAMPLMDFDVVEKQLNARLKAAKAAIPSGTKPSRTWGFNSTEKTWIAAAYYIEQADREVGCKRWQNLLMAERFIASAPTADERISKIFADISNEPDGVTALAHFVTNGFGR